MKAIVVSSLKIFLVVMVAGFLLLQLVEKKVKEKAVSLFNPNSKGNVEIIDSKGKKVEDGNNYMRELSTSMLSTTQSLVCDLTVRPENVVVQFGAFVQTQLNFSTEKLCAASFQITTPETHQPEVKAEHPATPTPAAAPAPVVKVEEPKQIAEESPKPVGEKVEPKVESPKPVEEKVEPKPEVAPPVPPAAAAAPVVKVEEPKQIVEEAPKVESPKSVEAKSEVLPPPPVPAPEAKEESPKVEAPISAPAAEEPKQNSQNEVKSGVELRIIPIVKPEDIVGS